MELSEDLSAQALAEVLPGRPVRSYPAMLSTEADALAWARAGAPDGAIVVSGYQAAPRGRAGRLWPVDPAGDLTFSMVLRPRLAAAREGWLYIVTTSVLADVCGQGASIVWPDEVRRDGRLVAAAAVQAEPAPPRLAWAVVSVLVAGARAPREGLLARIVEGMEAAARRHPTDLLAGYTARCETLGRRVCARLVPMGPNGQRLTGLAAAVRKDGALAIETDQGRRVAVNPQSLGLLEDA